MRNKKIISLLSHETFDEGHEKVPGHTCYVLLPRHHIDTKFRFQTLRNIKLLDRKGGLFYLYISLMRMMVLEVFT